MTWKLIDEDTDEEVTLPVERKSFRGEPMVLTDGYPPHKPSSTGKVAVESGGLYYPNVFGLKWVWHA